MRDFIPVVDLSFPFQYHSSRSGGAPWLHAPQVKHFFFLLFRNKLRDPSSKSGRTLVAYCNSGGWSASLLSESIIGSIARLVQTLRPIRAVSRSTILGVARRVARSKLGGLWATKRARAAVWTSTDSIELVQQLFRSCPGLLMQVRYFYW